MEREVKSEAALRFLRSASGPRYSRKTDPTRTKDIVTFVRQRPVVWMDGRIP